MDAVPVAAGAHKNPHKPNVDKHRYDWLYFQTAALLSSEDAHKNYILQSKSRSHPQRHVAGKRRASRSSNTAVTAADDYTRCQRSEQRTQRGPTRWFSSSFPHQLTCETASGSMSNVRVRSAAPLVLLLENWLPPPALMPLLEKGACWSWPPSISVAAATHPTVSFFFAFAKGIVV